MQPYKQHEVKECFEIVKSCRSKRDYIMENLSIYGMNTTLQEIIDELDNQDLKYNKEIERLLQDNISPDKLTGIQYILFSSDDYTYDIDGKFSLIVWYDGEVYRKDRFKIGTRITRGTILDIIEDGDNKTDISKYLKTPEEYISYVNVADGKRGKILSELITI